MSEKVITRFAPSPTGFLHVGSARTFILNWLYARRNGGTMILRLDDTDVERNTDASVNSIFEGLKWLGLEWDEGPFFQSQRLPLHQATAERLRQSGHAYYCFCTKEELEQRRTAAVAAGKPPMYDRRCRAIDPSAARIPWPFGRTNNGLISEAVPGSTAQPTSSPAACA